MTFRRKNKVFYGEKKHCNNVVYTSTIKENTKYILTKIKTERKKKYNIQNTKSMRLMRLMRKNFINKRSYRR